MSDFLGDFLKDIGFGGAQTGADITRMLGVQDPALQQRFGQGLDPLFGTVRKGLGELPELLATLTGQAQTTAGIGRERIAGGFQTGRTGLQQRGIELGRGGRAAVARAGFAGGGATQRQQQRGRSQLGRQFMDILGARRTGLAGVEAGLEQSLFGAGQRVAGERAGLLGSLGGGIQNLLNALISGGVEFGGGGGPTYDPQAPGVGDIVIPGREEPEPGYGGKDVDYGNWRTYRDNGGTLGYQDWVAKGSPEYDYIGGG